jgi:hypothetical protein
MVGIKPGDLDNVVMLIRDKEGRPIPNLSIQLGIPSYPPGTSLRIVNFKGY